MSAAIINLLPSERVVHAVLWTLINSLWIGAAAVFAGMLILKFASRLRSLFRYNLLLMFYALAISSCVFTFFYIYSTYVEVVRKPVIVEYSPVEISPEGIPYHDKAAHTVIWLDKLSDFVSSHAYAIFLVWFVFFIFNISKLLVSLMVAQKIRHFNVSPVPQLWTEKLATLSARMNIKKEIIFLESPVIKSPSVLGFFKPVLLVPLSFLTQISEDQVEAILMHELSHIRRFDYLINLLQCLTDNVFFFNPAFIWLSRVIREEREYCCDDLAIDNISNKDVYINALISFQKNLNFDNQLAMAFSGGKMKLLNRVQRIVYNETKTYGTIEGLALIAVLLVFSAFTVVVNPSSNKGKMFIMNNKMLRPQVLDTMKFQRFMSFKGKNGDDFKAMLDKKDQVIELYVNNKKVDPKDFYKYEEELKSVQEQKAKDDAALFGNNLELDKKNKEMNESNAQLEKDNLALEKNTAYLYQNQGKLAAIYKDLSKMNIVQDTANIEAFDLNYDHLLINGKKQPQEIHSFFAKKYLSSKSDQIRFQMHLKK